MAGEVERLITDQLAGHRLQRLADGYRSVVGDVADDCWDRADGLLRESKDLYGWTDLRFLPRDEVRDGFRLTGIAEIETEFASERVPSFNAYGIELLNARSVYGAFYWVDDRLRLRAQYSIYDGEPASDLAAALILRAFSGQLAFGFAATQAALSVEALVKHRTHLDAARTWQSAVEVEAFEDAALKFRDAGLFASPGSSGFCLEVPLSGDSPSRVIDQRAQTALLNVDVGVPHPLAGVGYLATIALPIDPDESQAVEVCRRLNDFELQQGDYVPRFGAWGLRGVDDELVYSLFLPTAEGWGLFHNTLMNWNVLRVMRLRDRFWDKDRGVVLDKIENSGAGE